MTYFRLFLLLTAICAPTIGHAACPAFGLAAEVSNRQFGSLAATRAVVVTGHTPRISSSAVAAYLAPTLDPTAGGDRGLILYVSDRRSVCAYFATSRADLISGPYELAVEGLALRELIDQTLSAIASGAAPVERLAHRRNAPFPEQSRAAVPLRGHGDAGMETQKLLARLSTLLFPAEIRTRIASLSSLTVVPAINIGTVPFAALDPEADGTPLVETTAVNIEASLRDVLAGRIFALRQRLDPVSVTGDPDAVNDPEWVFPRLPGAAREAQTIASRFGTVALIGPDATVDAVRSAMEPAQYIHVAAHGYSDPYEPLDNSFLALTDGRLTARDIQVMRLDRNPMVVMSACQTGLGGVVDAGIIGLARAFLIAGASGVTASLWNVDDEVTAWTMSRLVDHLQTAAPAEALRRAQNDARERWPDPKHWAAFSTFGSRIVSARAADDAGDLPLRASLLLTTGAGEPVAIDTTHIYPVKTDDSVGIGVQNLSDQRFTAVVDVIGDLESLPVDSFVVPPRESVSRDLVKFVLGEPELVRILVRFVSEPDIGYPTDRDQFASSNPYEIAVELLGADVLPLLVPASGISPLADLGPVPVDGPIALPLTGGRRSKDDRPVVAVMTGLFEFSDE